MAGNEQQLIKRRVFTDAGELIREDLAPLSIKNTRATLMAYWAEQDRIKAEQEAAAAAAAAEAATAPAEPDPLSTVVTTVAELESTVGGLAPRVADLEQLRLATPEAVLAGTLAIQRAAGAAALVEAAGQTVIAQVDAAAAAADARLGEIEGQVGAAGAAVSDLVAGGREQLEQTSAEMLKRTTNAISKRVAGLEVQAAQLRGPKGNKGEWGSGTSYGKGKPPAKHPSGREWAVGEGYIDYAKESLPLYVRLADGWDKPVPTKQGDRYVSAQVNQLDMAPRISTSQSIQRTGGAGGGGGEVLIEDRASQSWTVVADSSNWSAGGFYDPTAGKLMLEITDLGDARRGVVTLDFSAGLMAGQTALTESAMTGAIFNDPATAPDVDFDVVRTGAPIIPAGVTGTPVLSGGATQVRLRVGANLGGTKQYAISGLVWWTRKAEGKIANPDDVVRQPLWTWA